MKLIEIKLDLPSEIKIVESALQQTVLYAKKENQVQPVFFPDTENPSPKIDSYEEELPNFNFTDAEKTGKHFTDYVFAGGAFSNMYIQQCTNHKTAFGIDSYPFKDIDVFVKTSIFDYSYFQKLLPEAVFAEPRYIESYNGSNLDYIFDFTLNDIKFEFILSHTLEAVQTFDFRFRNFFHKNGETFASERAIQDIDRKEIVIISTSVASSSLVRGFIFEEQLGFSISPFSLDYIGWDLGNRRFPTSLINEYIEKKTLLHITKERILEKVNKYYQGRIGNNGHLVSFVSDDSLDNVRNGIEEDFEKSFLPELNACPFTNIPDELLWSWKSNWNEDEYEELFTYSTLDIFNKPTSLNMNYDLETTWKKYKSDLTLLMRQNFLTQMFSGQNSDDVFTFNELESIDFEMLLSFMENCPEKTQLEMLHEMDGEHVVIQSFMKWSSYARTHTTDERLLNALDDFVFHHSRIGLIASTSQVSLDNQIIVASLDSKFDSFYYAKYTFRLCDRGVYLLDTTESDNDVFFKEKNIRLVILHLINEHPGLFDFGIDGDTADVTTSIFNSHYFKYDEKKDKMVLKLKQKVTV